MKIKVLNDNIFQTNTYILKFDEVSFIIDPTINYNKLDANIKKKLQNVLLTHGHYDHFSEIESYKNHNLNFYMHKKGYEKLNNYLKNCSYLFGVNKEINLDDENVIFVKEGDMIGDIHVYEFFGHTNCSIAFAINDDLFSGDFLFKNSIGRTDLYSGNIDMMKKSIDKIKKFSENFTIYPGHDEITTLDDERKNNLYLYGDE